MREKRDLLSPHQPILKLHPSLVYDNRESKNDTPNGVAQNVTDHRPLSV